MTGARRVRPPRKRWVALSLGAVAVASAVAVVYLALFVPIAGPAHDRPRPDRRRARPDLEGRRVEAPLERRTRAHVVVHARSVSTRAGGGSPVRSDVTVLIDTALTLPITTPAGERRFALSPGTGPTIPGHGFSGGGTTLLPIEEASSLAVTIAKDPDPLEILSPVRYLGVDAVADADVIAPPTSLCPEGGAVSLDLRHRAFTTCETLEACAPGTGWTVVSDTPCASLPELVVIAATLEGAPARLLLDTGGSTWIRKRFFDAHGLARSQTSAREGTLLGAAGTEATGRLLDGTWSLGLGNAPRRTLANLYVIEPSGGAAVDCALDGSLGVDALDDCALALTDGTTKTAVVRCEG